jgi:IS5 family transposase
MRPKKHETTGSGDLFRALLDQIINLKHELVQLAGQIDQAYDPQSHHRQRSFPSRCLPAYGTIPHKLDGRRRAG